MILTNIIVLFLLSLMAGLLYEIHRLNAKIAMIEEAYADSGASFNEIGMIFESILANLPAEQVQAVNAHYLKAKEKLSAYFKKRTPEIGDFVIVGATKLDIASLDLCRAIARRLEREFLIWREDFIYGGIEVVAEWLNSLSGTLWDFGRYIEANYSRSVKLSDFGKSPKDYGFVLTS